MKALLLFTYNRTLEEWVNSGFLNREKIFYQRFHKKNIYFSFLTYGNSRDLKYSKILEGITVIPIRDLIKSKIPKLKFFKTFLLPLKIKSLFKEVDIIKTVQVEGSWVGFLSKILFKKKLIVRGGFEQFRNFLTLTKIQNKHNFWLYIYLYIKIYVLEYIAYKLADSIFITSESDIEFIVKTFHLKRRRNKIFHIPNYIDVNLFKPLDVEKKNKNILFIGRFHAEKNLDNLLNAFKGLKEYTLNIVGKGPFETYLKKWKEEENIKVNYLGVIPNEKLPEIINQHQVFILPSYYEGNPKTLLEAMSCGLACIGTNVRGINNIIKHKETGYLCGIDAQSIKDAILKVTNNNVLCRQIGKAARNYIVENYSLDHIIEKESSIYRKILRG